MRVWLEPQGQAADPQTGNAVGSGVRNEPTRAFGEAARSGKNLTRGWEIKT
jgi:hypothetical protein